MALDSCSGSWTWAATLQAQSYHRVNKAESLLSLSEKHGTMANGSNNVFNPWQTFSKDCNLWGQDSATQTLVSRDSVGPVGLWGALVSQKSCFISAWVIWISYSISDALDKCLGNWIPAWANLCQLIMIWVTTTHKTSNQTWGSGTVLYHSTIISKYDHKLIVWTELEKTSRVHITEAVLVLTDRRELLAPDMSSC